MNKALFIGIDIGTQGARVVLLDTQGNVVASAEEVFPLSEATREEQSPDLWWETCCRSIASLFTDIPSDDVAGIAVTSTSGTVIPLDNENQLLHNAIMYSDKRSVQEAELCKATAEKYYPEGYTGFNTSSGLSKMVWFGNKYPDKTAKISKWVHAADFITGKLSGVWGVTDYTNALKSGYDVNKKMWPDYLFSHLPLQKNWLPEVLASGEVIGNVEKEVALKLGLSRNTKVAVGITDGCASQIASGAVNPGDWNTTIGTTLVIKGVTRKQIVDPLGRLYSHRHPLGYWMPGGASNTGADWITDEYQGNIHELNQKALAFSPTGKISYPLRQKGERFPFIAPQAEGFESGNSTIEERFTSNMEGVAYLERYAYELMRHLSGEEVKAIYTAGGGSNSEAWLQIRSNILNLPIYKMEYVSGAVGAAILAASKTHYDSIIEAGKALTRMDKAIQPESGFIDEYSKGYQNFLNALLEKGYINRKTTYA